MNGVILTVKTVYHGESDGYLSKLNCIKEGVVHVGLQVHSASYCLIVEKLHDNHHQVPQNTNQLT